MSKPQDAASTYLKFLNLVQAIRSRPSFPTMDVTEEKLLNTFAAAWHSGKPLTVMVALSGMPDFSASTVHRRLTSLQKKGLVELVCDPADYRTKYIVGTEVAKQYFEQLGKCLDEAQGN